MGIDTQSFVDSTKKKILIADDNDDIREMLTLILKMEGYEVLGASNGEEAVMVAQLEHPDLIFMDVMMPRLSGVEAARQIHEIESMKNIPIVAISAFRNPLSEGTSSETFRWHAYLKKPIDPEELKRLLTSLF